MSDILQAIILGIIQGLTEFLPVSSSGHLEIIKAIFGDQNSAEESLMMTVVLHFATALSTVFVFRKDIGDIIAGLFDREDHRFRRFIAFIVLSMVPAVIIGLVWEEQVEALFSGRLFWIGLALIATSILLFSSDLKRQTTKRLNIFNVVLIGIAQAVAIIPGISRSGATIGTSVLLGITREQAARFSFLMVIPLIFGKMAKDLLDGSLMNHSINLSALVCGFFAAFITGALACTWMIAWVKNSKLKYFAFYCFIIGVGVIVYTVWV